jgi:tetratricopeptide (TPR) repeat protein
MAGTSNDLPTDMMDGRALAEFELPSATQVVNWHQQTARKAAPVSVPKLPGYEILGELGRGGMGVVYKARQLGLNRLVALKVILATAQANTEDRARFRLEAEAVARLHHDHIVPIFDVGEHNNTPYFSLEYCAGGTLAGQLGGTPLPPKTAVRLIEPIAHAIQSAHDQALIHRDIKPGNILLQTVDGQPLPAGDPSDRSLRLEQIVPKLTDFGLAKELDGSSGATKTGALLGTPSYMAPEQADPKHTHDLSPATDVWALGAVLYECLTGRPPFKSRTPMTTIMQVLTDDPVPPTRLQPNVPRDLETIVLKCLHKTPSKRYHSAAALADDLRRFREGRPILARPVGWLTQGVKWAQRRPAVAGLSGVVGLVFMLGLGLILFQWQTAVQARQLAEQRAKTEQTARAAELAQREKAQASRAEAERLRDVAQDAREKARQALDALTGGVVERLLSRQQKLDQREKTFLEQVLKFYQEFAQETGNDRTTRLAVAGALQRVGDLRRRLGLPEAEATLVAAARKYEELLREESNDWPTRQSLIHLYVDVAILAEKRGHLKHAEEHLLTARSWLLPVLNQGSTDPKIGLPLATIENSVGTLYETLGKLALAEQCLVSSRDLCLAIIAQADAPLLARIYLGNAQNNLSRLYEEQGRWAEAEAAGNATVATYRELVRLNPQSVFCRQRLAMTLNNLALTCVRKGRAAEAEAIHREALALRQELHRASPAVPAYRRDVALSLSNLAACLQRTGASAEVEKLYVQCLALREPLARDYPDQQDYQADLIDTYHNIAQFLEHQNRVPDARAVYDQAIAKMRKHVANAPQLLGHHRLLGALLANLGLLLVEHDPKAADAPLREALNVFQHLQQQAPEVVAYPHGAGLVYNHLTNLAFVTENYRAAREHLSAGRVAFTTARKLNSRDRHLAAGFRNHLLLWAQLHLSTGQLWDAATLAAELRDSGISPAEDYFQAAAINCRCAQKLLDAKPAPADAAANVRTHLQSALTNLRGAVERGFRDKARLLKDEWFAPLRADPAFKLLLTTLDAQP